MKPLAKNSLRVLLAVILIVVALALYLQFGAARVHHNRIEAAVSEAVGFDVAVPKPFSVKLGQQSEFTAEDVSLSRGGNEVAQVGFITVTVDSASVFSDTIEIISFGIEDLTIDVAQLEDASSAMTGSISTMAGTALINTSGNKPTLGLVLRAGDVDLQRPEAETDPETDERDALLFNDEPIDLTALREFNLGAHLTAKSIRLNENLIADVNVDAQIEDGSLRVERVRLGSGEGTVSGAFSLVPAGEQFGLRVNLEFEDFRIAAMAVEGQNPAHLPPLNLAVELEGSGQSMHEIMASANGSIKGRHASGQLDLDTAGALFSDLVTSIAKSLNPLAEDREFTTLECGIYDIAIVDGTATAEELAAQTDHLTVISSGTVNLETEEIDLTLSTKSREGLGLSLGGVANSFVKLGGTLKEPALNVDAAGTATTTGAAVATGGLSILAKSLWDRLSAEADLCAEEPQQAQ